MIESFVASWKSLLASPGTGKKEVGTEHPLRLVYGATGHGEALFFCITAIKPGLPELSNVVRVERRVRTLDGKWTLSLTLRDARFLDVFMRLCEDLARRSEVATSESQAVNYFLAGVADWKHLLRNPLDDRLSSEAIRGLIAELWFGFTYLATDYSVSEILEAWTGPMGSPQDFRFPDGQAFEVKSAYADTKSVAVSNAEQLDSSDRPITLAVVGVEQSNTDRTNSFTLPTLIAEIETKVRADAKVADLYSRFDALRLDISDDYYSEFCFEIVGLRRYSVALEFPSIRASALPLGLHRVKYSVALASMTPFLLSEQSA